MQFLRQIFATSLAVAACAAVCAGAAPAMTAERSDVASVVARQRVTAGLQAFQLTLRDRAEARLAGRYSRQAARIEVSTPRLHRVRSLDAAAGPPPLCQGRRATIRGTEGNDLITGTAGRDVIAGLGGNDEIHGLGQDDIICGGPGDDLIFGNGGNDSISGDDGHDLLDGGLGNDKIDGGAGQFDGAAFFDETAPVTASLATGTATGQGSDTFTNVEELHGGGFTDTFTGDAGNNGLFGNGGNDSLAGGGGDDYLSGGSGDDVSDGGPGNDTITFWDATGPVTASLLTNSSSGGGEGSDTWVNAESLRGGPYGDTLIGNGGDNFIQGAEGNDSLSGGDGNDFLNGGAGDDTMDGGPGQFDGVGFFDATGPVTANLANGTASGQGSDTFTNVETLQGSDYGDTLIGGPADDGIFGNGGNDSIAGGDGNDFMNGGPGDDSIDGGPGTFDRAIYFGAAGPVTASLATNSSSSPTEGNDTFANIEGLEGGPYNDTLTGNAGDNFITGAGGNDTLSGGDGQDFLVGGDGNDSLDGGLGDFDAAAFFDATGPVTASLAIGTATGEGSDTFTNVEQLHGGPYGDTFGGWSGPTVGWFFGNGGNDTITGGSGDEFLFGGDGNDSLDAGDGHDFVDGGLGNDTMDGGPGFDAAAFFDENGPVSASLVTRTSTGQGFDTFVNVEGLHGGDFSDTFTGAAADEEFFGNGGNDTVNAGDGNDNLNGGVGDDTLNGEGGDDYIDGGDGYDTVDGGSGFNTCVNSEAVVNCQA